MTLPESPDNTVLVLDRPRVLRATRPVIGADIGRVTGDLRSRH